MPRHRPSGERTSEAERLKSVRERLGYSQRDLAFEFRVAPAAVAQWESGARTMPGPALRLLELFEEELTSTAAAAEPVAQSVLPTGWAPRTAKAAVTGVAWFVLRHIFNHEEGTSLSRRVRRAAIHRYVQTLGNMKGLMMKMGQVQGYLNFALDDEERRELARLHTPLAPMPKRAATAMVQDELGQAPHELFRRWSPLPLATASIGQVHAAQLPTGEDVVVKVQYPRIVEAVEADLRNLALLDRSYALLFRGQKAGVLYEALAGRIREETDYRLEAAHQQRFRSAFHGHPDIDVPEVFEAFSAQRVLTTAMRRGEDFEQFCATAPQQHRDRAASALWEFYWRSALEHRRYNTDPHPGNFLFEEGRVTFIDFGRVQPLSEPFVALWRLMLRAALERDWSALFRCADDFGVIADRAAFDYQDLQRMCLTFYRPWLTDEPFTLTPEFMRHLWRVFAPDNPNKAWVNYSGEMIFLDQLFFGVYALLTHLRAATRFRPLMLDLLYRDGEARPPAFSRAELSALGLTK